MLNETGANKVYLASGHTDMRKSIDGLAALVREGFDLDPFSHSLFVFCNKQRDKLKVLRWSHNGFWLHYRRLEQGKFQWPAEASSAPVMIDRRELNWLLDGLSLKQPKAHSEMKARIVV
jgi:transposase